MQITALLHATLLVSDLEKSKHFYGTVLGLPPGERNLNFSGAWYQINNNQIHLITVPEVLPDQVNEAQWGRNRHLAFAIADLDAAKARLTEHGYTFQASASGRPALFVQDPDGNIIELNVTS